MTQVILRQRLFPHPFLSLVIFGLWMLLFNSLWIGHLLLGGLLACVIPAITRIFWTEEPRVERYGPVLRLLPVFMWDLVVANVVVALRIVSFWRTLRPVWIVIPLDLTNPTAVAILANMISLTPGTVSSALTPDRLELLVHVLDTDDPEAEGNRIKQRYERPLQEIFE